MGPLERERHWRVEVLSISRPQFRIQGKTVHAVPNVTEKTSSVSENVQFNHKCMAESPHHDDEDGKRKNTHCISGVPRGEPFKASPCHPNAE